MPWWHASSLIMLCIQEWPRIHENQGLKQRPEHLWVKPWCLDLGTLIPTLAYIALQCPVHMPVPWFCCTFKNGQECTCTRVRSSDRSTCGLINPRFLPLAVVVLNALTAYQFPGCNCALTCMIRYIFVWNHLTVLKNISLSHWFTHMDKIVRLEEVKQHW